ncbi:hypothetical protein SHI21_08375 [Bacteriovorax sp. PP10]|uniref:Lipoprotein n=1 Tax=Bacteriovorax antarcticus TaxID=3088717 RepID=A0ABU5VT43_9BACT|nr:hypothetical protein [Bacteriovorax sp. PP10]MEA9356214.1 hypothetical protein [Bacteriovorax sp. PP10]
MKLTIMVMLTMLLSISCTKRDKISDFEPGPNTSTEKDGSQAGQGSGSSLGSENPAPSNP